MATSESSPSPLSEANPRDFASAVQHGLRTPLAALRASMESWSGTGEPEPVDPRVDRALGEVSRLTRNVQALAEWAAAVEPAPLACSAEEIARAVVRARRAESDRILVACSTSSEPLWVDGPILTRSLIRLLDNALEAGPGPVLFRTSLDHGVCRFTLLDAGAGFSRPPAELERPFVTSKPGALGMGLPLARRDVERMGGQLRVEPTPLGLTRVTVTIPLPSEMAA